MIKLGEGILEKPEDICVDKKGVLYTATRDGWIKRMFRNGSWENWKMIATDDTLLGITTTSTGHLIVCDTEKVTRSLLFLLNFSTYCGLTSFSKEKRT